eukprot:1645032-Pleurochrysis_carterae.AAC.4
MVEETRWFGRTLPSPLASVPLKLICDGVWCFGYFVRCTKYLCFCPCRAPWRGLRGKKSKVQGSGNTGFSVMENQNSMKSAFRVDSAATQTQ